MVLNLLLSKRQLKKLSDVHHLVASGRTKNYLKKAEHFSKLCY